jgi:hypothetical protein
VSSPSGVQPVHCPVLWLPRPDAAVRPAGVQPVRCPAGWCPPGWCPSPSGVQPAVVHPSALSHPSRPASASGSDGGHPVRRGNGHDWIESRSRWSGPVPGGSVDGPMRHRCGHRCGGRVEAGGGASAADLGRVVPRREAAADRPGRPDRRQGRPSVATALGQGLADAMSPRGTVGRPAGLEPRLRCVVGAEPHVGVDRPGRTKRARRPGRRAAPARPREVAGTPARRRQRRDLREWWWARQGLNL